MDPLCRTHPRAFWSRAANAELLGLVDDREEPVVEVSGPDGASAFDIGEMTRGRTEEE